jgi:hypothetical protein
MQKSRNAMDDCLKILVYFGGVGGLYILYHLFQVGNAIVTSKDIRTLLTVSAVVLILVVLLVFSYIAVFLYERALRISSAYQNFKKEKAPLVGPGADAERLRHLELALTSVLEGIDRRLSFLEDRFTGEGRLLSHGFYANEGDTLVSLPEEDWAIDIENSAYKTEG